MSLFLKVFPLTHSTAMQKCRQWLFDLLSLHRISKC